MTVRTPGAPICVLQLAFKGAEKKIDKRIQDLRNARATAKPLVQTPSVQGHYDERATDTTSSSNPSENGARSPPLGLLGLPSCH